jgi:hypothetical protein
MSLPSSASSVSSASLTGADLQTLDVNAGLENEVLSIPRLTALTGRDDWHKTDDKYHEMDYISKSRKVDKLGLRGTLYYERKGCKVDFQTKKNISYYKSLKAPLEGEDQAHDGYLMGWNKIKWLMTHKKKAIIFFGFSDQTRYVLFNTELFKTFKRGMFQRQSRNKDGEEIIDKPRPGIYIPFDQMVLVPYHEDGKKMTQREIDVANGNACLIVDDDE